MDELKIICELMRSDASKIVILSIAVVLDMITGVIKAVISHDLKSSTFKQGLLKKCYDYVLVVIAVCLDFLLGVEYISTATLFCLIAMEFYSCLENLREYVPVPDAISNALDILNNRGREEESD